jgi:hypothetical protein
MGDPQDQNPQNLVFDACQHAPVSDPVSPQRSGSGLAAGSFDPDRPAGARMLRRAEPDRTQGRDAVQPFGAK